MTALAQMLCKPFPDNMAAFEGHILANQGSCYKVVTPLCQTYAQCLNCDCNMLLTLVHTESILLQIRRAWQLASVL